jgi:hypothetical protein
MITIDQLLESVDLDFEPRWVTKDEINGVRIWDYKPDRNEHGWLIDRVSRVVDYPYLKLAEFDGKDWTECIYEVPRKTTGKIERLEPLDGLQHNWLDKINELVDAVNELKGKIDGQ